MTEAAQGDQGRRPVRRTARSSARSSPAGTTPGCPGTSTARSPAARGWSPAAAGRDYLPGTEGYYFEPTILADVTNDARIVREEVFGPVVVATPFSDDEHAVQVANDTIYGLAAGVWTQNLGRAHRFAHAVKAGTIWLNDYGPADAAAPFGGFKQSGYGREHGGEALNLFLETKAVWVNLAS